MNVVPDYIEPLVGYRAWGCTADGALLSLNNATEWPGREPLKASCSMNSAVPFLPQPTLSQGLQDRWKQLAEESQQELIASHGVPRAECSCGVYAAKSDLSLHFRSYAETQVIWGEVYLWGKIQDYTEGYRAEFAYPKALYVAPASDAQLAKAVGDRYGVPVTERLVTDWHQSPLTSRNVRATYEDSAITSFGMATSDGYGLYSGPFVIGSTSYRSSVLTPAAFAQLEDDPDALDAAVAPPAPPRVSIGTYLGGMLSGWLS